MLIHNKGDIEFDTEFPCLLGHPPVLYIHPPVQYIQWKCFIKSKSLKALKTMFDDVCF